MEKKEGSSFLTVVVLACVLVLVSTIGIGSDDRRNPLLAFGEEAIVVSDEEETSIISVARRYLAMAEEELPADSGELSGDFLGELSGDVSGEVLGEISGEMPQEKTINFVLNKSLMKKYKASVQTNTAFDADFINEFLVKSMQDEEENIVVEEQISGEELIDVAEVTQSGPPTEYKTVMDVTATAYCLCQKCCGKSPSSPGYGRTSSGLVIVPGQNMKVIAVDPKVIPLGTKVYVQSVDGSPDYGYAIAADTGGAIKNGKIDLYKDTHKEALQWGRRQVKLYVID
jgi:3D (Asp-Asp-Asp) domain-containing protein